ncbi:MAG: hypothetical protein IKR40_02840 [Treponema sp.]|nr:hypothetical protein [Treponema sp.]
MEEIKQKKLSRRITDKIVIPNVVSGFLLFVYSLVATQIPLRIVVPAVKYVVLIVLGLQFTLGLLAGFTTYAKADAALADFNSRSMDDNEKISVLKEVSKVPVLCGILTLIFFVGGAGILSAVYHFYLKMPKNIILLSLLECIYGAYMSTLEGYMLCRLFCQEDIYKIVRSLSGRKEVMAKKVFGISANAQFFAFICIPIIFTSLIAIYALATAYPVHDGTTMISVPGIGLRRMMYTTGLNFLTVAVIAIMYYILTETNNKKMCATLEAMEKQDLTSLEILDTDLTDKITYSHYLVNQTLLYFKSILSNSIDIGVKINSSANLLLDISNQSETTAMEQSTGTSEIVSTMEAADSLSKKIETKISDVNEVASKTAENVQNGTQLLIDNLVKMVEIARANEATTKGIREVSEQINNIWDIVTIINSVADQTKIIAFNAELESTTVRENGRNFRNVSNEIRRLANGTMDSTKEIKERIKEIQEASNNLLQSSQNCTTQINHGMDLVRILENNFSHISASATKNAGSAEEIKNRIGQESEAFGQIVATLHQVSHSIENFSESTRAIISTAQILESNAKRLSGLKEIETITEKL